MRIREMNDIHLEHQHWIPPRVQADVALFSGDIAIGINAFPWMKKHFGDSKIIYVMGNHEWYRHKFPYEMKKWKEIAADFNIHILDNDELVIGDVRFLGATLWTDYNIIGNRESVMQEVSDKVHDYSTIRYADKPGMSRRLQPADLLLEHQKSIAWLKGKINTPFKGKTVVATHHAPHHKSLNETRYKGTSRHPLYASNLEHMMDGNKVHYWFHGHTHIFLDYMINGTRILSNPRGYPGQETGFDPELIITI